jgi:hypothetical protein
LLSDLKEARDRLNQDSRNSSRPPSSDSVYGSRLKEVAETEAEPPSFEVTASPPTGAAAAPATNKATPGDAAAATPETQPETTPPPAAKPKRKAGHQPGAPGVGRTQKLAFNTVSHHRPTCCAVCGLDLPADAVSQACGGFDEIDLLPADLTQPGLSPWVTRHLYYQVICPCGHHTRYASPHAPVRHEWKGVGVDRQQMLGPRLAGLVVMLCLRYRLSRVKVRELLWELTGLQVSTGLIDQTLRQSAGQIAPVEDLLIEEVVRSGLLYVDETPWRERGRLMFLWVFNAVSTIVYFIGPRSGEIFTNALQGGFAGVLMSDGYAVYRAHLNRIRCQAHLLRKAIGLSEATCGHTRLVGQQLLDLMNGLIKTVQAAHDEPIDGLAGKQAPRLAELKALCEQHQHSPSVKLGELCREFLLDWAAIVRPLLDASLPLTNNAAERQLRHWVIARRISFGTRSEQGSRALALLASVIDTCRARKASAWDYLAAAISAGRQALPLPQLPAVPVGG